MKLEDLPGHDFARYALDAEGQPYFWWYTDGFALDGEHQSKGREVHAGDLVDLDDDALCAGCVVGTCVRKVIFYPGHEAVGILHDCASELD